MGREPMTNEELAELIRTGIERLDAKIDGVEDRLGGRIDQLGNELNGRIDRLERKIDDVAAGVRVLNKEVHGAPDNSMEEVVG